MKTTTKPPTGCTDLEAHERDATALADKLQARALEMLARDGRIDVATGKELAIASVRARKLAAELAQIREDVVLLRESMEHEKQMSGIRVVRPVRAPLKRGA